MSSAAAAPSRAAIGQATILAVAAAAGAAAVFGALMQLNAGRSSHIEVPLVTTGPAAAVPAATLRSLLSRQPLSSMPLVAAGEAAARQGDLPAATQRFEHALLRNPRSVVVRLWLAEHYVRTARFADAVVQLDALMRLRPTLRRELIRVLIPLTAAPQARGALAAALVRNPVWARDFIDGAARNPRIASSFYELLYTLGGKRGFVLDDSQLTRVVTTALSRGDYRSARLLYLRFAPRTDTDPDNQVFDPDFRGAAGPPPFNWLLAETSSGSARIDALGATSELNIHIFGGDPAVLATQSMLVAPGDYWLSTNGTGRSNDAIDGLSWRLVCDRTRLELGRLEIASPVWRGQPAGIRIAVPPLCSLVTLKLAYASTARPSLGTAALGSVSLTPLSKAP